MKKTVLAMSFVVLASIGIPVANASPSCVQFQPGNHPPDKQPLVNNCGKKMVGVIRWVNGNVTRHTIPAYGKVVLNPTHYEPTGAGMIIDDYPAD